MKKTESNIVFRKREFKGSRLKCLLLTNRRKSDTAEFLSNMVQPYASVSPKDKWQPKGFLEPSEARLAEAKDYLPENTRNELTDWWLETPGKANTPNWDLVSTCMVNNKPGLILVEAKAHERELVDDRCGATNQKNYQKIRSALDEANKSLSTHMEGFNLSADTFYQLSNRFAFAWKIASMGTPVVLVYLGFLDAFEMKKGLFDSHKCWHDLVLERSLKTVPPEAWNHTFNVNGTSLTVLIRSASVEIIATSFDDGEEK